MTYFCYNEYCCRVIDIKCLNCLHLYFIIMKQNSSQQLKLKKQNNLNSKLFNTSYSETI